MTVNKHEMMRKFENQTAFKLSDDFESDRACPQAAPKRSPRPDKQNATKSGANSVRTSMLMPGLVNLRFDDASGEHETVSCHRCANGCPQESLLDPPAAG